ncbi:MAG: MATE family efflux transporter [Acidobacteriota bacterium]
MATDRSITRGAIGPVLLRLAGPVIAAEAIHTAFHLVDVAWVGPLGAWASGAIMTSMFTLWMAFSLGNLVTTGLTAHVSRAIGAGDRERAGHAVAQGFHLCVALALVVMAAGYAGAPRLFTLLGEAPRTAAAGTAYLRIITLGAPMSFLYLMGGSVMRACGNTVTPMIVTGSALALNAALAPFLIYGWAGAPRLGVAGSAVATIFCMALACAAYVVLALAGHPALPLSIASLRRLDGAMLGSLVKVGAPSTAIGALFSIVYLWYAKLAGPFGDAAVAVLGIGNRIESITYLTADGFAIAAATFVGQNLGGRDPLRAEKGAWLATGIMSAIGGALMALFLLAPGPLLDAFTNDAEVIRMGVPYLRILALCQVFTGLEGVIGGGFAGAGNTVPPMAIHVAFALLRIPMAAWAVGRLGLTGIAWVISLTCIVRAMMLAFWFSRGAWKRRVLPGTETAPEAVPAPAPVA